jgi:hypothetical protein
MTWELAPSLCGRSWFALKTSAHLRKVDFWVVQEVSRFKHKEFKTQALSQRICDHVGLQARH